MANTFTGLKLQGMIGKFGAKEISDIEGKLGLDHLLPRRGGNAKLSPQAYGTSQI